MVNMHVDAVKSVKVLFSVYKGSITKKEKRNLFKVCEMISLYPTKCGKRF